MHFDLWSILLIASSSQCLFLGVMLVVRPSENRTARTLLLCLLTVILLSNVHNFWYASYLYRLEVGIAGFARGATLLLGPLLYFYVRAVTQPSLRLRPLHLLHLIPYLVVASALLFPHPIHPKVSVVSIIDQLMEGNLPVDSRRLIRFLFYAIHLLGYVVLARVQLARSLEKSRDDYQVSMKERGRWLRKITVGFLILAVAIAGLTGWMLVTGTFSITVNFVLSLIISVIVYLIAYQSLIPSGVLSPGFREKYNTVKVQKGVRDSLLARLTDLLEREKVFADPDLKIAGLAQQLETTPHLLSRVINSELNLTFNGLLNEYRVAEFKRLAKDPEFANLSIMGMAYEVGYNSKSSFYTAFRKQTGVTPTEYLKAQTAD